MLNITPYRKRNEMGFFNPFRELDDLGFFGSNGLNSFRTDIEDVGDKLILSADLPGFKKEDIHVDVEDDRLLIRAERHSNYEKKDEQGHFLRCERSYGSFSRSFSLEGIDPEHIEAAYENGVLKMELPKRQPEQPKSRRLEIK